VVEPEEFWSRKDSDVQERFEKWTRKHPDGLLINRWSASKGMLHRVRCGHFQGVGGDVTEQAKVCHTDRRELEKWADENGVAIGLHNDCDV
jgi:hypothetical protein